VRFKIDFIDDNRAKVVTWHWYSPWKKDYCFVSRESSYYGFNYDPKLPNFSLSDKLKTRLEREAKLYTWRQINPWKKVQPLPKVIAKYKVLREP
jgi:hypothetical protein